MGAVVTVFGSARIPEGAPEYGTALQLGRALGAAGFSVCNGGYGGAMEAVSRGAKEAGAATIGVSFHSPGRTPNRWIDRVVPTTHLSERLLKLVELGDAYVVLKGGTGTLLELACVWEFVNKGIIPSKPIVLLGRFWEPVLRTLREEQQWEGLGDCTTHLRIAETPDECVKMLREGLAG
jgi:uncharacterized protein (TIGR00730 family)